MNTELFDKHKHELEEMIRSFFLYHPEILRPDEGFEVRIVLTKRFVAKIGQVDLDQVLDLDVGKIIPPNVPIYSTKIANALENANKFKIRDVVKMTRYEFLKYRNVSTKCLRVLEEWLSTYDDRLSIGMKL